MTRRLMTVLFAVTVVCSLLGGFHYYIWARLVRGLEVPEPLSTLCTVALLVGCISIPLSLIGGRLLPRAISEVLFRPVLVWMGSMFILVVALFATDLARWAFSAFARWTLDEQTALSVQHSTSFAWVALGLAIAGVFVSFRQGARFVVKSVEVPLPDLPAQLDGFNFVQLSDVHVGPSIGRNFLRQVVTAVNALGPAAVVITGDLVDGPVHRLREEMEPLKDLEATHGTFFVTGNHEYYSGAEDWCRLLPSVGVRVLRNECVSLGINGAFLDLLGIDDFSAAQFGGGHGANLPRAHAARTAGRVSVLLAHQPRAAFEAAELGISLQLSGHTHGGQIWPFSLLVRLQQPLVSGLHRIRQTWVYVSNGTGYWGPPMRLFAPAEVTNITLRRRSL